MTDLPFLAASFAAAMWTWADRRSLRPSAAPARTASSWASMPLLASWSASSRFAVRSWASPTWEHRPAHRPHAAVHGSSAEPGALRSID